MSNRERWIVYPLLFYALVMGFKSTYRDPLEFRCRTIECQNLNVKLINGSAALANPAARSPTNVIVLRGAEEVSPSTAPTAPDAAPVDLPPVLNSGRVQQHAPSRLGRLVPLAMVFDPRPAAPIMAPIISPSSVAEAGRIAELTGWGRHIRRSRLIVFARTEHALSI
jgi:hypothetical protein